MYKSHFTLKIIYNSDFVNNYLRSLYNPKNSLINLHKSIKNNPIIQCDQKEAANFQLFIEQLKEELGEKSSNIDHNTLPILSDTYTTSLIISMLVLFTRYISKSTKQEEAVSEELETTNKILRYISSNLQEKITLEKLSKIFYLSESTIAKYLHDNIGFFFRNVK